MLETEQYIFVCTGFHHFQPLLPKGMKRACWAGGEPANRAFCLVDWNGMRVGRSSSVCPSHEGEERAWEWREEQLLRDSSCLAWGTRFPHPTGSWDSEKTGARGSSRGPTWTSSGHRSVTSPAERGSAQGKGKRLWGHTGMCRGHTVSRISWCVGRACPCTCSECHLHGDVWSEWKFLHPVTWSLPNFQLNQLHSRACDIQKDNRLAGSRTTCRQLGVQQRQVRKHGKRLHSWDGLSCASMWTNQSEQTGLRRHVGTVLLKMQSYVRCSRDTRLCLRPWSRTAPRVPSAARPLPRPAVPTTAGGSCLIAVTYNTGWNRLYPVWFRIAFLEYMLQAQHLSSFSKVIFVKLKILKCKGNGISMERSGMHWFQENCSVKGWIGPGPPARFWFSSWASWHLPPWSSS